MPEEINTFSKNYYPGRYASTELQVAWAIQATATALKKWYSKANKNEQRAYHRAYFAIFKKEQRHGKIN